MGDRPCFDATSSARWDYRVVITYPDYAASTHGEEVERGLFPDHAALDRDEQRRWELTLNHWDLPVHEIDPRQAGD